MACVGAVYHRVAGSVPQHETSPNFLTTPAIFWDNINDTNS